MTGKSHAVLWLGFTLIIVRLFTTKQWHDIWGTLGNGANLSASGGIPYNNIIHKLLTPAEVAINTGKTATNIATHPGYALGLQHGPSSHITAPGGVTPVGNIGN
jgi:hypothetical protein